ncbi:hypothetical protein RRG08_031284 [Elysia crispata]|uniref:Uncharacterized protein n=1 Tax=Elysia crispata TaxID=231223 RepID=A0AAE1AJ77_9GAST|nr:hypothetical protein RRG08_031284 [Elysia crispata]
MCETFQPGPVADSSPSGLGLLQVSNLAPRAWQGGALLGERPLWRGVYEHVNIGGRCQHIDTAEGGQLVTIQCRDGRL